MLERTVAGVGSEFPRLEFFPGSTRPTSALIYLHGIGERGKDISIVKRYGLPSLLARRTASANCAVICPQLEFDRHWEPERLVRLIGSLRESYARIALMGYSLGGVGVCDVVGRYGSVATPSVAIAGRSNEPVVASQEGTTFLAIQGEHDPWPSTEEFARGVISKGGVAHEIVLPDQAHYISEVALSHPLLQSVLAEFGFEIVLK